MNDHRFGKHRAKFARGFETTGYASKLLSSEVEVNSQRKASFVHNQGGVQTAKFTFKAARAVHLSLPSEVATQRRFCHRSHGPARWHAKNPDEDPMCAGRQYIVPISRKSAEHKEQYLMHKKTSVPIVISQKPFHDRILRHVKEN